MRWLIMKLFRKRQRAWSSDENRTLRFPACRPGPRVLSDGSVVKNLPALVWLSSPALIAPALAILLFPKTAPATGIESPLRWTDSAENPQILLAPEFYFELEVKRLAAELQPSAKAAPGR